MARRKQRNPWVSAGEVFVWVLFALLLFPVGFAGWAVGHYTSLGGKSSSTHTVTLTVGGATTSAATTSATTAAATTAPATTAAGAAGDAAKGKTVFASQGCGSCHTFKPAGSSGSIGPDLDTQPQQDAKTANMPLAAFLHQSIVDPNAYIASGYPKGVMPQTFGSQLSSSQLADLVAFLLGGRS